MKLNDEELIWLYNFFRNMKLLGFDVSKYVEKSTSDDTSSKLQRKVKKQIETRGYEWMLEKKIKKWW